MTIDATQSTQDRTSIFLTPEDIETQFGGDLNAEIAALMLGHARDVRDGARQARASEEKTIEAQENQQVEEMRNQAEDLRRAGAIEGSTEMVGGALGVLAGSTGKTDIFKGSADIVKGTGTMGAAWYKGESQIDEANGTAASHHAQAAIRRLDDIKDVEKDARDLARNAIDFYRDQVHTQADADHAALFLRG
jgi:hypothetical protein